MPDHPQPRLFREVKFDVPGRLFCHSMPGRMEPVARSVDELQALDVKRVVSLVEEWKTAPHAAAVQSGGPWLYISLPIPDYGIPIDVTPFLGLVRETAADLQHGKSVLVHCGAGIGRTGTFAVAVKMACGLPLQEATQRVTSARSGPENEKQRSFLKAVSQLLP